MVTTPASLGKGSNRKLSGLARHLVNRNLLDENTASQAIGQARKEGVPLSSYLVEKKLVTATDIAHVASREFSLPLVDLSAVDLETAPIHLVDERLIRWHRALPLFRRGKQLFVALSDPTNLSALEDIKFQTSINTEPIVVDDAQLTTAIEKALDKQSEAIAAMLDKSLESIELDVDEAAAAKDVVITDDDTDDAPVVRFVNRVLVDAIHRGASDIHFEPYEKIYRVRFRQDGILYEINKPPVTIAPRLAARLKVMAQLDIAERRVPQDGRIKIKLSKHRATDFRISTMPTLYGEKLVLRILDPATAQLGVDALGYEAEQKQLFLQAIKKPQGMVLVTGPTGSGKTVSLYTALNILNTPGVNISTVEDPVEIYLPGVNQVNVNIKTGMTFANALRAFLRQDPDIIMVGEIRDLETAEIAIKAAQTGHMVLSTVHTNDAPKTLNRLMNMGVAAYNIASSVTLIIAQRLARRLCNQCKEETDVPREELLKQGFRENDLDELIIFRPAGCDQCAQGYRGRIGIYQVMPVSEEMGQIMMSGGNAVELAEQARREGINELRRSGLNKVKEGITSLEEINRVIKE